LTRTNLVQAATHFLRPPALLHARFVRVACTMHHAVSSEPHSQPGSSFRHQRHLGVCLLSEGAGEGRVRCCVVYTLTKLYIGARVPRVLCSSRPIEPLGPISSGSPPSALYLIAHPYAFKSHPSVAQCSGTPSNAFLTLARVGLFVVRRLVLALLDLLLCGALLEQPTRRMLRRLLLLPAAAAAAA
jgi:hypothetical protein